MSDEKKKEGNIERGLEETPYGIKRNLKACCNIKFKNFSAKAGKVLLRFPVSDQKTVEKTETLSEIFKSGEIELGNVCMKKCDITVDIPQIIQEIISLKK